jgi:hypothetical protein
LLTNWSGGCTAISAFCVPPLLLAPNSLVALQWKKLYDRGSKAAPPFAAASALAFSFLSYKFYGTLNHPKAELYALSALLTIGIVPYTLIAMVPTNNKLMRKAEDARALSAEAMIAESEDPREKSAKELLDLWATHNLARGMFPLAGAILGLWTTLTLGVSR